MAKKKTRRGKAATELLTVQQAAKALGISRSRVNRLITGGRLKAVRFASVWAINPADLEAVRVRKPGRPKSQ